MNDLDKLIRHHEGGDYLEEEVPQRFHYWVNLTLLAAAIAVGCGFAVGVGYCAFRAFGAVFG